jgi:hypothetical protein
MADAMIRESASTAVAQTPVIMLTTEVCDADVERGRNSIVTEKFVQRFL